MKLSIRVLLIAGFLFCFNLSVNAASSVKNASVEHSSESETFKNKTKQFFQKHIVKKAKKKVQAIKAVWSSYKEESRNGPGLSTLLVLLLTATFVTLKLTGIIAWSWLWVLSPLWIPIALGIVGLLVGLIVFAIVKK